MPEDAHIRDFYYQFNLKNRMQIRANSILSLLKRTVIMPENHNKDKIIAEFNIRKKHQWIISIPLFIIIIFFLIINDKKEFTAFGLSFIELLYLFIAIIIAAIIFSFYNWRCPSCEKYLGKGINPKFCSKCGAKLQE